MSRLSINIEESSEIPPSLDFIVTGEKVVLALEEKTDIVQARDFGEVLKDRKRMIGVSGSDLDDGTDLTSVGEYVFFIANQDGIYCLSPEGNLTAVHLESLGYNNWEVLGLDTDRKLLYAFVDSVERAGVFTGVFDTNLELKRKIIGGARDFLYGNNIIFEYDDEEGEVFTYNKYFTEGQVEILRNGCLETLDDIFNCLFGCQIRYRSYPFQTFTDGSELYVLSEEGILWHLRANKDISIGKVNPPSGKGIVVNNGERALLVSDNLSLLFENGQIIGQGTAFLNGEHSEFHYVGNELYGLVNSRELRRYSINLR